MNIKSVKGILAAGGLVGIVVATLLGLGLRDVTRAGGILDPAAALASPAESVGTLNWEDGDEYGEHEEYEDDDKYEEHEEYEHEEEHESGEYDD